MLILTIFFSFERAGILPAFFRWSMPGGGDESPDGDNAARGEGAGPKGRGSGAAGRASYQDNGDHGGRGDSSRLVMNSGEELRPLRGSADRGGSPNEGPNMGDVSSGCDQGGQKEKERERAVSANANTITNSISNNNSSGTIGNKQAAQVGGHSKLAHSALPPPPPLPGSGKSGGNAYNRSTAHGGNKRSPMTFPLHAQHTRQHPPAHSYNVDSFISSKPDPSMQQRPTAYSRAAKNEDGHAGESSKANRGGRKGQEAGAPMKDQPPSNVYMYTHSSPRQPLRSDRYRRGQQQQQQQQQSQQGGYASCYDEGARIEDEEDCNLESGKSSNDMGFDALVLLLYGSGRSAAAISNVLFDCQRFSSWTYKAELMGFGAGGGSGNITRTASAPAPSTATRQLAKGPLNSSQRDERLNSMQSRFMVRDPAKDPASALQDEHNREKIQAASPQRISNILSPSPPASPPRPPPSLVPTLSNRPRLHTNSTEDTASTLFIPFIPTRNIFAVDSFTVRTFVARLRQGIIVLKHPRSRYSKSSYRILHSIDNGRTLSWTSPSNETPSKKNPRFSLLDCCEIRHGWTVDRDSPNFTGTRNLRKKCAPEDAFNSFSLIFPTRTIDITALSSDQAAILIQGLNGLCFKFREERVNFNNNVPVSRNVPGRRRGERAG